MFDRFSDSHIEKILKSIPSTTEPSHESKAPKPITLGVRHHRPTVLVGTEQLTDPSITEPHDVMLFSQLAAQHTVAVIKMT